MAISGTTIATRAVRMLTGVQGYTLSTNEAADGLTILNSLLDSLQTERLMIYQILQESKLLTVALATYTMGPTSGTFGLVRPVKIESAFIRDSSNLDYDLDVVGFDQYYGIVQKTQQNTLPRYLFNDCAFAAGIATITLWPVPSAAYTLFINSWKQLQVFAALADTLVMPPGYQRFLEYALAIDWAPEFGRPITAEIMKGYKESRAAIKTINAPEMHMRMPAGVAGGERFNIYTG